MKKYPSMFGVLAAVLLVASFIVPGRLITPSPVEADPAVCAWDTLSAPTTLHPIFRFTDIIDMSVSGSAVAMVARAGAGSGISGIGVGNNANALVITTNSGISVSTAAWVNWRLEWTRLFPPPNHWAHHNVYLVALAPGDPTFIAIVTDAPGAGAGSGPREVWITTNAGGKWEVTNLAGTLTGAGEFIRWIDISVDYGGRRDIAVGTVDGAGGGDVYVLKSTGFTGWIKQGFDTTTPPTGDFHAGKFSPSYASDAALALVYATTTATYYNISLRDIDRNGHRAWAFPTAVEVKDPSQPAGSSPEFTTLNRADLELPSDFSGQAASLRRAYISLDAYGAVNKATSDQDGIFRIDDQTVYELMDTATDATKSIYSIAYFGTFASGKLLAGERMGYPCTATVPTWFTDAPTTCPIPCWYPALKPITGAANLPEGCPATKTGQGGALVGWRGDGHLAFATTGSLLQRPADTWFANFATGAAVQRDESALSISRNNGETWNQINMIDTLINNFTDVAPTPDCKTIYLASVSSNATETAGTCNGFDSVWRSSTSADVNAPLPGGLPVGTWWERVLTRVTAPSCAADQSNMALLRLVPYCQDETGQIVAWGAYAKNRAGTTVLTTGVAMWSPDYGDYWAVITPRNAIQDFCFESKTVLYFLSPTGMVQRMPYTGTAWATTLPDVNSWISAAHTIAAYPEGQVIVGADKSYHGVAFAASFSSNFHTATPSFTLMTTPGATFARGDVHVAFHPKFKDNKTVFIADTGATGTTGSVYRNHVVTQKRWAEMDMMGATNGAVGCNAPHPVGQYGIVLSYTGEALYSAHGASTNITGCAVDRTIDDGTGKFGPLSGMPKPGVAWDCLNVFVHEPPDKSVCFTNEPSSLTICGCCKLDTDSTLFAIDNDPLYSTAARTGMVWRFTDCMAKKGPKLVTADKMLIGCDPVSGRAAEVNLCWEQLCVADAYDIEIAKDKDFTLVVVDVASERGCWGVVPADVTKPCVFFPAGGHTAGVTFGELASKFAKPQSIQEGSAIGFSGQLECGKTYYWRVKVRECATGQWIRSPWSEVRSFTVKAGLPVSAPYQGIQPLAPANGATGISIDKPCFSWAPLGDVKTYEFTLMEGATVVKTAQVSATSYCHDGKLKYNTSYTWRVRPLDPAGDVSPSFVFRTETEPAPPPPPEKPAPTPLWVWVVIAIGAILVIVTLVLIFKTRRV